jgi:hypothetical protein
VVTRTEVHTNTHEGAPDSSAVLGLVSPEERRRRAQAAIALLDAWSEGDADDADEQRTTWELLKRALDESRAAVGARLLFP